MPAAAAAWEEYQVLLDGGEYQVLLDGGEYQVLLTGEYQVLLNGEEYQVLLNGGRGQSAWHLPSRPLRGGSSHHASLKERNYFLTWLCRSLLGRFSRCGEKGLLSTWGASFSPQWFLSESTDHRL